ncbi:MAG: hypothetical protein IPM06_17045 [Rhizobiales bacterium]|nr:hypothetical protein [Hyphomicrobiales bacterium]
MSTGVLSGLGCQVGGVCNLACPKPASLATVAAAGGDVGGRGDIRRWQSWVRGRRQCRHGGAARLRRDEPDVVARLAPVDADKLGFREEPVEAELEDAVGGLVECVTLVTSVAMPQPRPDSADT